MTGNQGLPEWNLQDLYTGQDAPELETDLLDAEAKAIAFHKAYQGKLASLNGLELASAIEAYEVLLDITSRVMSFAQLLHATHSMDQSIGQFFQTIQERVNAITSQVLFFALELNVLDDEVIEAQLAVPEAARYASWVFNSRVMRPHQLTESEEKLLHDKEVVGRSAWVRLFDETLAHLRFELDGHDEPLTKVLDQLTDNNSIKRKAAGHALAHSLRENEGIFSMITNTLAKDKEIDDRWRKFESPAHPRHLANRVETHVVEALVNAVRDSYSDLAHRYYGMKATWMGVEKLEWWDRNAPVSQDINRQFTWNESREIVLDAYYSFEPEMAEIASRFFDNGWIDAPPREGKNSGAFAHPTVPSAHPYVLLNFHGKPRDVMTLAHELGHGVHQVLAARQGLLLSQTPLTLAETASVFGEMLTFRSMLDKEKDPDKRRVLLAGKVEDMLNTVVRQIAFHEFETRIHNKRKEGELMPEQIGDIWMQTQTDSLGPAFNFDEDYRVLWSYIPHFVHAPFYVYAYAFGDCLVNALFAIFKDGHPRFQEKYMNMLAQGGRKGHKGLLEPFGLDAGDPGFWKKGLMVISGFIDELEEVL